MDPAAFILLLFAGYFVVAAFVPRVRMRWGFRKGLRSTILKPHMGAVTCAGMATMLVTFSVPFLWKRAPAEWLETAIIAGFLLVGFGAIVDWIREPTIRRKT